MNTHHYLVDVCGVKYITIEPIKTLTVGSCNSTVFRGFKEYITDNNQCVFDFFRLPKPTIIERLDRRTKKYKELRNLYGYFSVDKLRLFTPLEINLYEN